ncbi:ATP-binding protein [Sphaerisporangium corydalis]|uniref:ATP-binding protein n=1 Tax=Sphaerisporangium corydalis TaxID=1441875 RepID=A0ABV9E8S2_9ACTN|nr:ATP-binding protein [Sphaerisporangium corydalis]
MKEDEVPPPRFLTDGSGSVPLSSSAGDPAATLSAGLPLSPGAAVREMTFCVGDLPDVRDFAALQARRAGMAEAEIGDYLVAVNEVATNAVTHGAAKARLRVWSDRGDLMVDVHDDGQWAPDGPQGMIAPHDYSTSGMGLWVARRLASALSLRTGLSGTNVTMRFPL